MGKELQIRNSTVDFLVFTRDAGEDGIEVRVQNHDVWLTQKAISQLFDVDRSVVTKHLKNVFVVIQLGAILAVVVMFWNKMFPFQFKNKAQSIVKRILSRCGSRLR